MNRDPIASDPYLNARFAEAMHRLARAVAELKAQRASQQDLDVIQDFMRNMGSQGRYASAEDQGQWLMATLYLQTELVSILAEEVVRLRAEVMQTELVSMLTEELVRLRREVTRPEPPPSQEVPHA